MKILRNILPVLLVAVVNISAAHAQDDIDQDSIRTLLQTLEGEDHFRLLIELSENSTLESETRVGYAEDAVDYAEDLERVEFITEAYINLGNQLDRFNDNDGAIRAYEGAYNVSEEGNYREGMAEALVRLAVFHIYLPDQDKATEYLEQARDLAKEIRNLKIEAESVFFMGELQRRMRNDLSSSSQYYEEALLIAREAEDQNLEANIINELGFVSYLQGDFRSAINNYEAALPIYTSLGEKYSVGRVYLRLANSNFRLARYDIAIAHYQEAHPIFVEVNSQAGISAVLNGMALIYFSQNFPEKALDIHFQQLELAREMGDQREIGRSLDAIANAYSQIASDSLSKKFGSDFQDSIKIEESDQYLELFRDALDYYYQALEIRESIDDKSGVAGTLYNLGIAYLNSGKPDQARQYLERSLILNQELNERASQSDLYLRIGQVYLAYGNLDEASRYLQQSLEIALELDIKNTLEYVYLNLSVLYARLRNLEQALTYVKLHSAVRDTMNLTEKTDQIADMQVKYETEATEKENALLVAQSELADIRLRQQRIILTITIIAIGIFLVMVVQLIRQNNLKRKANRKLAQSNTLITEQKKEITDSIQYASRIQNAMLPPGDYVDKLLPERFIIFMPRDIVSGDYYYITEKDNKIICVTADCTGHGVPGAFMSMLGIAFLNEIISKQAELHTDEMLGELRSHVIKSLHQTGKEGESQDGMDLAVYIADLKEMKIEFSGANNSLFVFRNGEMIEAKADKMPIGSHTRARESFTRHNLDLKKGDMIYTFTDGYPDQFGGPRQRKFMIRNFREMLRKINKNSVKEQKKIMEETLADWMADTDQVDDILVIGVRI